MEKFMKEVSIARRQSLAKLAKEMFPPAQDTKSPTQSFLSLPENGAVNGIWCTLGESHLTFQGTTLAIR